MSTDPILLEYRGKIAIVTLNLETKLNALTQPLYYQLAQHLRAIDQRPEIYITILTAKGRFFSAGADFGASNTANTQDRQTILQSFVINNLEVTRAFSSHSKILITALNGPVIGLSAALIAHSDFIYCTPSTYLLTPFSSLGLVTEGGSSTTFVQRLGLAKANEVLILSKRIGAKELLRSGFVHQILAAEDFHEQVLAKVLGDFGDHLNSDSLLQIKALIRRPAREMNDRVNVEEVMGGLARFEAGIPQEEFRKLSSGEKKHKL